MRSTWPKFARRGDAKRSVWHGTLQPTDVSPRYQVSIEYELWCSPKVRVVDPPLVEKPPHVYPGGILCLYHPDDWEWDGQQIIAHTIVPWTAGWLFFYELWLDTEEWLGPEAGHPEHKKAA